MPMLILALIWANYFQPNALFSFFAKNGDYELAHIISPICKHSIEFTYWSIITEYSLGNKDYVLTHSRDILERIDNAVVPERYINIVDMLVDDVQHWPDDDSDLNNIARDMKTVNRRLELARGGPITQHLQQDIINKLDKNIKNLEEQLAQQQQQMSASSSQSSKSAIPLPDSKIMASPPANGDVSTKKILANNKVWGSMPEKEKLKAIESIRINYPPYYQDAIEGYLRKVNGGK